LYENDVQELLDLTDSGKGENDYINDSEYVSFTNE